MNAVHFFFSLSLVVVYAVKSHFYAINSQRERVTHTHTHTWLFIINHRMYCVAVGWRSLVIYLCIIFLSFIRVPDQIEILNWMMIVWAHFPSLRNVILIVLKEENWEKDNHFLLSFNHFCFVGSYFHCKDDWIGISPSCSTNNNTPHHLWENHHQDVDREMFLFRPLVVFSMHNRCVSITKGHWCWPPWKLSRYSSGNTIPLYVLNNNYLMNIRDGLITGGPFFTRGTAKWLVHILSDDLSVFRV